MKIRPCYFSIDDGKVLKCDSPPFRSSLLSDEATQATSRSINNLFTVIMIEAQEQIMY